MKVGIDFLSIEIIIAFAMVVSRISGAMLVAPILSRSQIPAQIKIGLSILLASVTFPEAVNFSEKIINLHPWHIIISLFFELAIGYFIGFIFNLIFDAISTLGQATGMQIGQGSAMAFNPSIGAQLSPTSSLLVYIGYFAFLLANGFHIILLIIQKSYEVFPIAQFEINLAAFVQTFLPLFHKVFLFGLQIVIPLLGLLVVFDLFTTLVSKIIPQGSMFFLFMPIKLIVGSFFFSIMLPSYWLNLTTYFNDRLIDLIDQVFLGIS